MSVIAIQVTNMDDTSTYANVSLMLSNTVSEQQVRATDLPASFPDILRGISAHGIAQLD